PASPRRVGPQRASLTVPLARRRASQPELQVGRRWVPQPVSRARFGPRRETPRASSGARHEDGASRRVLLVGKPALLGSGRSLVSGLGGRWGACDLGGRRDLGGSRVPSSGLLAGFLLLRCVALGARLVRVLRRSGVLLPSGRLGGFPQTLFE